MSIRTSRATRPTPQLRSGRRGAGHAALAAGHVGRKKDAASRVWTALLGWRAVNGRPVAGKAGQDGAVLAKAANTKIAR